MEPGRSRTIDIEDFVALDEITHVAFGNKWLRALTGSEEGVEQAIPSGRYVSQGGRGFGFELTGDLQLGGPAAARRAR